MMKMMVMKKMMTMMTMMMMSEKKGQASILMDAEPNNGFPSTANGQKTDVRMMMITGRLSQWSEKNEKQSKIRDTFVTKRD